MLDGFRTNHRDNVSTNVQKDLGLWCAIRAVYALEYCTDLCEQTIRHKAVEQQSASCPAVVCTGDAAANWFPADVDAMGSQKLGFGWYAYLNESEQVSGIGMPCQVRLSVSCL